MLLLWRLLQPLAAGAAAGTDSVSKAQGGFEAQEEVYAGPVFDSPYGRGKKPMEIDSPVVQGTEAAAPTQLVPQA
jgi:hypothetical protein